jgi:hypothetical protein
MPAPPPPLSVVCLLCVLLAGLPADLGAGPPPALQLVPDATFEILLAYLAGLQGGARTQVSDGSDGQTDT